MNPLRVLHVTPYSGDAWAYGGIPRIADALAPVWRATGTQSPYARPTPRTLPPASTACARRVRAWQAAARPDGVDVHVFPNVSNRLAYHAQLFLAVRARRISRGPTGTEFDVAHLHACRNRAWCHRRPSLRAAGSRTSWRRTVPLRSSSDGYTPSGSSIWSPDVSSFTALPACWR